MKKYLLYFLLIFPLFSFAEKNSLFNSSLSLGFVSAYYPELSLKQIFRNQIDLINESQSGSSTFQYSFISQSFDILPEFAASYLFRVSDQSKWLISTRLIYGWNMKGTLKFHSITGGGTYDLNYKFKSISNEIGLQYILIETRKMGLAPGLILRGQYNSFSFKGYALGTSSRTNSLVLYQMYESRRFVAHNLSIVPQIRFIYNLKYFGIDLDISYKLVSYVYVSRDTFVFDLVKFSTQNSMSFYANIVFPF